MSRRHSDLDNDHVPAPDADTMYVSGYDGHIHRVPLSTGEHRQVTSDDPNRSMYHFLHGVSPDDNELAFDGVEPGQHGPLGPAHIFTIQSMAGRCIRSPIHSKADTAVERDETPDPGAVVRQATRVVSARSTYCRAIATL